MKIGILITARLKSTRLPLKVVKPIHGKPMVVHMIERLKHAQRPQQIILCTSPIEQDDPLVDIAKQAGIPCFRGHPDDVLGRLTAAAKEHNVDVVINCTADNPFVDPEHLDKLVDYHIAQKHDFTRVRGLPLGSEGWGLTRTAMEQACELKASLDTEVWAGYFTETGKFRWGYFDVTDPAVRWPELRLTVDTPEDFQLVTAIFDELGKTGKFFGLREIEALCRARPDLVAINAHIKQAPPRPIQLKAKSV